VKVEEPGSSGSSHGTIENEGYTSPQRSSIGPHGEWSCCSSRSREGNRQGKPRSFIYGEKEEGQLLVVGKPGCSSGRVSCNDVFVAVIVGMVARCVVVVYRRGGGGRGQCGSRNSQCTVYRITPWPPTRASRSGGVTYVTYGAWLVMAYCEN
jgi:hypothetical protein